MQAGHRVAKNTGILYLRMAITVFISLYSTRLVLDALGVADFGLFNVVAGVITMLGFLNSSMAAATQRFMSFAQGAGDLEQVKRIFNMSTILHIGIAVLMVLILEIAGYFFLNEILIIAPDRLEVAKIIYHFMVVSTFFTMLSVPYEAVITSHENMLFYAILGIIEALLKLGIALYLSYSAFDHLIAYGFLMAVLSIFLLILRRIYCHRYYVECELNFRKYYEKKLLKEISSFAGWYFFGVSAGMLSNYGQGIVINMFFGTVINAAQGIASQVSGQLSALAGTMQKALNPMMDKSEGSGDRALLLRVTMTGSKVSFFLLLVMYIPFLLEMPYLLNVWLTKLPTYVIIFCQLLLARCLIEQLVTPLFSLIIAVGKIKKFQIITSICNLFPLIFSYIFFKMQYPPATLYLIFLINSVLIAIITIYFAKINCGLSIIEFMKNVIVRSVIVFFTTFFVAFLPVFLLEQGILRLTIVTVISTFVLVFMVWKVGLDVDEKINLKKMISSIIAKISFSKMI
jgi:O-antigen/teichoic acid export membrane protein